jgi:hypothetical protein
VTINHFPSGLHLALLTLPLKLIRVSTEQRTKLISSAWRRGNRRAPKGRSIKENGRNDLYQWIGLREHLQENPIFNGKIDGFL